MYVSTSACNTYASGWGKHCLAKIQIKLGIHYFTWWHPRWCGGKESALSGRTLQFDTGVEKIPGVGNGNPLPCFCMENPMVRRTWQATLNEGPKSQIQLSMHEHAFYLTDLSSESP